MPPTAPPLLSTLLPTPPQQRVMTVEDTVGVIYEQVIIRPQVPTTTHIALPEEQWGWEQLRDYVVTEIEKVQGVFPRDTMKERGIFSSFVDRWGAQAPAIARYAFDVAGGYWKNAPISVTRFCKGSDDYFAKPIAEHLAEVVAARAVHA